MHRSLVWNHYEKLEENEDGSWTLKCIHCGCAYYHSHNIGTASLQRHVNGSLENRNQNHQLSRIDDQLLCCLLEHELLDYVWTQLSDCVTVILNLCVHVWAVAYFHTGQWTLAIKLNFLLLQCCNLHACSLQCCCFVLLFCYDISYLC